MKPGRLAYTRGMTNDEALRLLTERDLITPDQAQNLLYAAEQLGEVEYQAADYIFAVTFTEGDYQIEIVYDFAEGASDFENS